MKGVDAAVATILLLMITVSLIGFAFVWFNRLVRNSAQLVENQTISEQQRAGMKIKIVTVHGDTVTVQNIGTVVIPANSVTAVVNNEFRGQLGESLAPNEVKSFTLSSSCGSGDLLKVSAPGNDDFMTCE